MMHPIGGARQARAGPGAFALPPTAAARLLALFTRDAEGEVSCATPARRAARLESAGTRLRGNASRRSRSLDRSV